MDGVGFDDFVELYTVAKKFYENLNKEPIGRRENLDRVNKLIVDNELLEKKRLTLEIELSKAGSDHDRLEDIKEYNEGIKNYLSASRDTLLARLNTITENQATLPNVKELNLTMSEKFDIRTAASLLPCLDGSEEATKQLIDSIQLYSDMLNNDGQKMLINYVLKTRLTQSAKLRLSLTYNTVENLITDIKTHLLTKKSAAVLATDLHNSRQNNKSIDEYSKNIEELLTNLTLAQADGDQNKIAILKEVNEKLAINAFSNGLRNSELRTIIKARNYSSLKDAIVGAKDEETLKLSNSQHSAFHLRHNTNTHHNNSARGSNRGNRGRFQTNFSRNSHSNSNTFNNNFSRGRPRHENNSTRNLNFNNNNNYYNANSRGRGSGQGRYNNRGHQTQFRNVRNYFTNLDNETSILGNSNSNNTSNPNNNRGQRFFRP